MFQQNLDYKRERFHVSIRQQQTKRKLVQTRNAYLETLSRSQEREECMQLFETITSHYQKCLKTRNPSQLLGVLTEVQRYFSQTDPETLKGMPVHSILGMLANSLAHLQSQPQTKKISKTLRLLSQSELLDCTMIIDSDILNILLKEYLQSTKPVKDVLVFFANVLLNPELVWHLHHEAYILRIILATTEQVLVQKEIQLQMMALTNNYLLALKTMPQLRLGLQHVLQIKALSAVVINDHHSYDNDLFETLELAVSVTFNAVRISQDIDHIPIVALVSLFSDNRAFLKSKTSTKKVLYTFAVMIEISDQQGLRLAQHSRFISLLQEQLTCQTREVLGIVNNLVLVPQALSYVQHLVLQVLLMLFYHNQFREQLFEILFAYMHRKNYQVTLDEERYILARLVDNRINSCEESMNNNMWRMLALEGYDGPFPGDTDCDPNNLDN